MAWVYLVVLSLVLWGACGGVMTIGRRIWTLDKALRVHLIVAPVFAFLVSALHKLLASGFSSALRAAAITGIVIALDALVVAPLFERSYAMFRSFIGTWLPFALIFPCELSRRSLGFDLLTSATNRVRTAQEYPCLLPRSRTVRLGGAVAGSATRLPLPRHPLRLVDLSGHHHGGHKLACVNGPIGGQDTKVFILSVIS